MLNWDVQQIKTFVTCFVAVAWAPQLYVLSQVNRFCEYDALSGSIIDIDAGLNHDRASPNDQNIKCGRRSVWEVFSQHSDFSEYLNHVMMH